MDKHRLRFLRPLSPPRRDWYYLSIHPVYIGRTYITLEALAHIMRERRREHTRTCVRVYVYAWGRLSCQPPMYTRPGTTDVKSTMLLDVAQTVGEPSSIDENVAPRMMLAVYIRLRKFTRRREEPGLSWKLPVVCNLARRGRTR